jgi:sulfite reductase (NADPH) flavoprotein alpha-component
MQTMPPQTIPLIPETAPFTPDQRMWLNGFLAGLFSRGSVDPEALRCVVPAAALQPLTILFGSQSGTSELLAKRAAKEAGKRGFAATVIDMAAFGADQLAQEKNVLVITSTHGDGEPPDNAKALHSALAGEGAPRLGHIRYSVCGLGDTNYIHFCQAARDFDARFAGLGASRASTRAECDLDYEETFKAWLDSALGVLAAGGASPAAHASVSEIPLPRAVAGESADSARSGKPSRKTPFPGLVVVSRNMNAAGSAKRVHHVEVSVKDSGMAYEVGDALGIVPQNGPEPVADVLAALGCDGEEAVAEPGGSAVSLRRALSELYCLGRPTAELLAYHGIAPSAAGGPHHVLDVLLGPASRMPPGDFVRCLRRLQPRLYSIASSPKAHAEEVHLAVAMLQYEAAGRTRKGVCSSFLAERVVPGQTRVGVFVHSNTAFRPPERDEVPMIMIGPGTGIAPFRAFLEERRATGATGRNWLFFGDQRAGSDFLYRDEILGFHRDGLLTRLDTAFSRDQPEKIYVQHRMIEHASEFYAWLEDGAHVYVCGEAARMAKDVDGALCSVIERAGSKSREDALTYVNSLRASRRYCRDVY